MLLLTRLLPLVAGLAILTPAVAIDPDAYVSGQKGKGYFTLVADGKATPFVSGSAEFPGVTRAIKNLQADIKKVTSREPTLLAEMAQAGREIVLVGTLGKSPLIDLLVKAKKLDVTDLTGKWETFVTQIVEKPMPGVDRALVIAGSDKRGTIFGICDLSAQIGVSPWTWWADVPVQTQSALYVLPGRHTQGTPAVKYRPALPKPAEVKGFVESHGYVSIEAEHASRKVETAAAKWLMIPDIGRTASGMTISPVTVPSVETPSGMSPRLEYAVYLADSGTVQVQTYLSPSLNFNDNKGLRYAISRSTMKRRR